jgi:uncharacterized protein YwqG
VQFVSEVTLPTSETLDAELNLTRDEFRAYWKIERHAYSPEDERQPIHRLLGYPQTIQGDMQLECQLASHGLYLGTPSDYRDPRAAALRAGAPDWRLLLQVDTDDVAETEWGDGGRVYYWLPAAALARRDFSAAWLILQCY